jgi:DNA polymerase III epsilon subunit-like protein
MSKEIEPTLPVPSENVDRPATVQGVDLSLSSPLPPQIMCLDLETSGLGSNDSIIEIVYHIYQIDNQKLVEKNRILINDGTGLQDYFKKIPIRDIRTRGMSPRDGLTIVAKKLSECQFLVGHNIVAFDSKFLKRHFDRFRIDYVFPEIYDTQKILRRRETKLFQVDGKTKAPKLEEAVAYCYPNFHLDWRLRHTADYDVTLTWMCFKRCLELQYVSLPGGHPHNP